MGRWIIFFSYLERFNKIIYKTFFSFFLNLFPFYPSFELLKIKQNHPLLMAINVTQFFSQCGQRFLKLEGAITFFSGFYVSLKFRISLILRRISSLFHTLICFPWSIWFALKTFELLLWSDPTGLGRVCTFLFKQSHMRTFFRFEKEMRYLKSKSWNRKEGNIFATICD